MLERVAHDSVLVEGRLDITSVAPISLAFFAGGPALVVTASESARRVLELPTTDALPRVLAELEGEPPTGAAPYRTSGHATTGWVLRAERGARLSRLLHGPVPTAALVALLAELAGVVARGRDVSLDGLFVDLEGRVRAPRSRTLDEPDSVLEIGRIVSAWALGAADTLTPSATAQRMRTSDTLRPSYLPGPLRRERPDLPESIAALLRAMANADRHRRPSLSLVERTLAGISLSFEALGTLAGDAVPSDLFVGSLGTKSAVARWPFGAR